MQKAYRLAGWLVVWLTAFFFLQNGVQKVIGVERMEELFRELGCPDWFRIAVGLIEIAGAVLLAIPRFTLPAAAGMAVLMIGAMASEARAGHAFEVLLPAQWLVVFLLTICARVRIRRAGRSAETEKDSASGMS